jgi:hypothetical protein
MGCGPANTPSWWCTCYNTFYILCINTICRLLVFAIIGAFALLALFILIACCCGVALQSLCPGGCIYKKRNSRRRSQRDITVQQPIYQPDQDQLRKYYDTWSFSIMCHSFVWWSKYAQSTKSNVSGKCCRNGRTKVLTIALLGVIKCSVELFVSLFVLFTGAL